MSLKGIAKANADIVENRFYTSQTGVVVDLSQEIDRALASTQHYRPPDLARLLDAPEKPGTATKSSAHIEVISSKTGEAARMVAARSGVVPAALNFASAKNPGGGYVNGAKAQEEDLARCSALYYTQRNHMGFYQANRQNEGMLYLDHIIYSGSVPFFRDEKNRLLEEVVSVAIITAPAPNAGEALRRKNNARPGILATLHQRAGMVLAVAQDRGHSHLVLGAWGCGVFRNRPEDVADAFGSWLESPRFAGVFEEVVFAIYERGGDTRMRAFRDRFE